MRLQNLGPKTILLLSLLLFTPASYGLLIYGCWKGKLEIIVAGIIVLVLDFLAATSGRLFQQVLMRKIGELKEVGLKGAIFITGEPESEGSDDDTSSVIDPNLILKDVQSKLDMPADQVKEIIDRVISGLSEGVILEEEEDDETGSGE